VYFREVVVGAVPGLDSNGSFDHLLAAFSNLRKSGQPAKLVIFAAHDTQQLVNKAAIQELYPDLQWVPDELSTRDLLRGERPSLFPSSFGSRLVMCRNL